MSYKTYDSYTTADGTTYQAIYKGDSNKKVRQEEVVILLKKLMLMVKEQLYRHPMVVVVQAEIKMR